MYDPDRTEDRNIWLIAPLLSVISLPIIQNAFNWRILFVTAKT